MPSDQHSDRRASGAGRRPLKSSEDSGRLFYTSFRRATLGRVPWVQQKGVLEGDDLEFCTDWWVAGIAYALVRKGLITRDSDGRTYEVLSRLVTAAGEGTESARLKAPDHVLAAVQSLFLSPPVAYHLVRELRLNLASFTFVNPETGTLEYPPPDVVPLTFPFLVGASKGLHPPDGDPSKDTLRAAFLRMEEHAFRELLEHVGGSVPVTIREEFRQLLGKAKSFVDETRVDIACDMLSGHLEELSSALDRYWLCRRKAREPSHEVDVPDQTAEDLTKLWQGSDEQWEMLRQQLATAFFNGRDVRTCAVVHQSLFIALHRSFGLLLQTYGAMDHGRLHEGRSLFARNYEDADWWNDAEKELGIAVTPEWESLARLIASSVEDGLADRADILTELFEAVRFAEDVTAAEGHGAPRYRLTPKFHRFWEHFRKHCEDPQFNQHVRRYEGDRQTGGHCCKDSCQFTPPSGEALLSLDKVWELVLGVHRCVRHEVSLPPHPFLYTHRFLERGSGDVRRSEVAIGLTVPSELIADQPLRAYFFCDVDHAMAPLVEQGGEEAQRILTRYDSVASRLALLVLQPWYDHKVSEQAAKAEWQDMVRGVTHHIGNALTPIKVIAETLADPQRRRLQAYVSSLWHWSQTILALADDGRLARSEWHGTPEPVPRIVARALLDAFLRFVDGLARDQASAWELPPELEAREQLQLRAMESGNGQIETCSRLLGKRLECSPRHWPDRALPVPDLFHGIVLEIMLNAFRGAGSAGTGNAQVLLRVLRGSDHSLVIRVANSSSEANAARYCAVDDARPGHHTGGVGITFLRQLTARARLEFGTKMYRRNGNRWVRSDLLIPKDWDVRREEDIRVV
jgi:hypothetical protein